MFRLIFILSFTVLASTLIVGQSTGRDYWTKTVLATESTCKLRIGDGVFSPGESSCSYDNHLAADTKVFLRSITRSKPWAKLKLESESGETFAVEIWNREKAVFNRIFDSFFASEPGEDHYPDCGGSELRDYVTSVGFPTRLTRTGNQETWSLSYAHFSTQRCGFEIATLRFVASKLESLEGEI